MFNIVYIASLLAFILSLFPNRSNIYLSGFTDGSLGGTSAGSGDGWLAKYNSTGGLVWKQQLGTSVWDRATEIAVDSTGLYVTGETDGSLAGTNAGSRDVWLAKYDLNGGLLWKKQLGTSNSEGSFGLAIDGNSNIYITGDTWGNLQGTNAGQNDVWLAKYNSNGALIWTRQVGTDGREASYGVAVDATGNVYLTGDTERSLGSNNQGVFDLWVMKYDSSGTQIWKQQLGTSAYDTSRAIATDSNGNILITGRSDGSLAGTSAGLGDVIVAKYNLSNLPSITVQATDTTVAEPSNSGQFTLTRTGSTDSVLTVNYTVSGTATNGTDYSSLPGSVIFAAGSATAVVNVNVIDDLVYEGNETVVLSLSAKNNYVVGNLNSATVIVADNDVLTVPNLSWARQLGTVEQDHLDSMTTDSFGNTYVIGDVRASLGGTLIGGSDVWLAKYNSGGSLQWTRQIGTSSDEFANDIAVDSSGNVYLTGSTYGSFGGTNSGLLDAWVVKYDTNGTRLWTRQLGTSAHDQADSIVVSNSGNVYVVGGTQGFLAALNAGDYDVWVAKYDSSGSLMWTRQFGTSSNDFDTSVSGGNVDIDIDNQENIYISGGTDGVLGTNNLGSSDAWLTKYDTNGNRQWLKQTGTSSYDYFIDVLVDKDSGYLYTLGTMGNQYWVTNWLTKFDNNGNQIWSQQLVLDTNNPNSFSNGFSHFFIDNSDNIYLTKNSYGGIFIAKYSSTGSRIWLRDPIIDNYGDNFFNVAGIEVDNNGNIYMAGGTTTSFGGTFIGAIDAWVAKYSWVS